MAVSLKAKSAKAAKSATAIIVDRIVELRKKFESMAAEQKEYDKLVKDLREQAMEQAPDQMVVFEGSDYNVTFSEATKVRKLVDMKDVKKALGNEVFMNVAKVTLGDLDKYLTPNEVIPLVTVEPGPRKIDVVEK